MKTTRDSSENSPSIIGSVQRLRRQLPIFAFRDESSEDHYIEPLPDRVQGWFFIGRVATYVAVGLVAAAAVFLGVELQKMVKVKNQLASSSIQTWAQLQRYAAAEKNLKSRHVEERVKEASVITALTEALGKAKDWEVVRSEKALELTFSVGESDEMDTTQQRVAETLAPLGWKVAERKDLSKKQLKLKFTRER